MPVVSPDDRRAELADPEPRVIAFGGGTVTVKNALWNRRIDTPGSIFDLATRRSAVAGAGGGPGSVEAAAVVPLKFEIQLLMPSTLRVENNLARLVASADLTLRGTYDRPVVAGHADIERGEGISQALAKHSVFPSMIIRMMTAGEQTGNIDTMLERVSDFLDEEINNSLTGLMSLIEPMLIVVLGVVIGGMVICMFLPIFNLANIVNMNGH